LRRSFISPPSRTRGSRRPGAGLASGGNLFYKSGRPPGNLSGGSGYFGPMGPVTPQDPVDPYDPVNPYDPDNA